MSIDDVSDITPRIQFVASASQTAFDYPFPIFEEADLKVYQNGTLLTLTTHYTVTGETEEDGGTVTLVTGASSGDIITIYRDIAIERTSDFQQNGPLASATINDQLDRLTLIAQQLESQIGRCIRVPYIDENTDSDLQLGDQDARASKFLAFDTDGSPTLASSIGATALTSELIGTTANYTKRTALEDAASITPSDYTYPPGMPERYGAAGDGVTVDTTAVQRALTTGHGVRGLPGSTYLVGPLTQSTARQFIDFRGCTLKRINSSAHSPMLSLTGQGATVVGGRWDGNKANQSGSAGDKYGHAAVYLNADYCEVYGVESYNSYGIGIKGANCSYIKIHDNVSLDSDLFGIYVESLLADRNGWEVYDNRVLSTGIAAAGGIYLTGSDSPFTYKPRHWRVSGNVCRGATSSPTGVGITTRGEDGTVEGNVVTGYTIGISTDTAIRTTIAANRVSDAAGATGYGIELNGGNCTVTGNVIQGGTNGISISGAFTSQPYNTITGNYIENPSARGIYVQAATNSARYLTITGNTIQLNGATTGRTAITLAGDCKYSTIASNNLIGPGNGISSCRGVLLDNVVSHVSILGNRFSSWERPLELYAGSAVTYTDITFSNNDCTYDMPSPTNFVVTGGSATIGARVVQMWNNSSNGVQLNLLDHATSLRLQWSGTFSTPESNVVGAIGSLYVNTGGGAGTTLFVKESGAGNTGWAGI